MAYRTDGTANFNFFINRQGPRGPQGIQGPGGFSPNVQVEEDHGNTFTLRVTNKDNFFITSNLREHKEDRGGDYIRYDRAGQLMYIGDPDFATTVKAGEVRLSTVDDLTAGSDTVALTPKVYKDDITNIKTEIQGDITATNLKIDNLDSKVTRIDNNTVKVTGDQDISGSKTFTDEATFTKGINTAYLNTQEGEAAINVTRQDIAFYSPLKVKSIKDYDSNAYYLRQGKVIAGDNVQIVDTTDGIKISSTAQGDVTLAGDNSFTGNNTFDGVSTFNGDTWVNSLKVGTSLTNQQDKKFLVQGSVTAGDNISIEETTDGVKISSTGGGGSAPENMVTTDTAQIITGSKLFNGFTNLGPFDMRDDSDPSQRFTANFLNDGVELVIANKNSEELVLGVDTTNAWFKPFYKCSNFYINNYGDNSAENGIAANIVLSGVIKNKVNNVTSNVLTQKNITAGSDNLLITETTDGVQITCNAPTNAQIEALQRLINDLSTKIDNLTTRLNNLEEVIDGGVAGSIYAPEPQKLQEQVVEGLSINEKINSVSEDVQVNDNGGT